MIGSEVSWFVNSRDQRPREIVRGEVARGLISKGGPTIETTVFSQGYVASPGALRDERRVTSKPLPHAP
jgi:hypothetical protein